jgi:hypothetical protein
LSFEHQTNTDSYIDVDDISNNKPDQNEEKLKENNSSEKLPKSIEETEIKSLIIQPDIQNFDENNFRNNCANYYENRPSFTQYNNNQWLTEIYKNYFLAAVTQSYLQVNESVSSINAPRASILHSNNLFQHQYQHTSNYNNQSNQKQENVTCKYCYLRFSDNLLLNFHIRKSHSQILLNYS